MTLDIRANVYCSIGPIIQGSFADDHLQGSGLIKTRGSVELAGIYRPDIGQVVEFAWSRGGIAARIPRKLRVLSSFADPFRRVTTVQLGCKLTMFDDVTPNIGLRNAVSGESLYVTSRVAGRRAETGGVFVPSTEVPTELAEVAALAKEYQYLQRFVAVPMTAAGIVRYLCDYMKITIANDIPLQNTYTKLREIDLTGGILPVLSDLLVSESYVGFLNERERLVIRSLDTDTGTGPVVDADTIIDLSPIGVGNRPGEAVVVAYTTTRRIARTADLEVDYDPANPITNEQLPDPGAPAPPTPPANPVDPLEDVSGWREDRTVGFPVSVPINYTTTAGDEVTVTYSYKPLSVSVTEYLNGKQTKTVQTSSKPLWAAAPAYTAQRLAAGLGTSSADCVTRSESSYIYDEQGRQLRMVTREYESEAEIAGGLSLQFVFEDIDGGGSVTLSNAEVQTSETIVEKFYAGNFEKTVTARYVHWAKTQAGQQNSSESRLTFQTAARTQAYVSQIATATLVADGLEVQTTLTSPENQVDATAVQTETGRDQPSPVDLERRAYGKPAATEKYSRNEFNVEVVQETANILYRYGSVDADRVIRLSLPYADDAAFTPTNEFSISGGTGTGASSVGIAYMPTNWTPKLSRVQEQALQFGRVQNRLLIGNRQGVSLQLPAELLPSKPFDPLYIKADNLTGQYRVNAASWTFSRDGIVASVDALFWGGVGS
jgi:hypothetical protein